jgi:hypothetical protein
MMMMMKKKKKMMMQIMTVMVTIMNQLVFSDEARFRQS